MISDTISKLHKVLANIEGKDLAQMSAATAATFRKEVTQAFKEATAGLQEVLLGEFSSDARWLWKAEEAESFGSEWIASYSVVDTGQMEAAVGKHEKIQMAAAIFPSLSLTVDIFAAYHHPGGTGLQVDPKITIKIEMCGDPELALVEHYLELSAGYFPQSGNGVCVEIIPLENCCDEVRNPTNILSSFVQIANAAREAALEENEDTSLTEAVEISVSVDSTVEPDQFEEVLEYMGQMFARIIVAQK